MRMEFRDRLWNQLDFQYFWSGKAAGNVPKTIFFSTFQKGSCSWRPIRFLAYLKQDHYSHTRTVSDESSHESTLSSDEVAFKLDKYRISFDR